MAEIADNITLLNHTHHASDFVGGTISDALLSSIAKTVGGGSCLVVASNTATQLIKNRSDYICDGTADQVEINAAIQALPSTGGKIICVGEFYLTGPILIDRNSVCFEGVGLSNSVTATQQAVGTRFNAVTGLTGQVIKVQEAANNKPCYGTVLRDFTIDGGFIDTATDGILFRANRSRIENVHVQRVTGAGIHVRGYTSAERGGSGAWDTYDTSIVGCEVGYCLGTGLEATATSGTGIWFDTDAPDCHVMNCVLFNNYDGIRIGASSEQITANHVYDSVRYNILFDNAGSRTKIVGNKIEGAGSHGLFFDNTTAGTSGVIIVGNGFKNNGDAATNTADHINITGSSTNGHTSITIVGNTFTKDSATSNLPRNAINMSTASQGTLIDGNSFGPDSHFGSTRISGSGSGSNPTVLGINSGYKTRAGGSVTVSDGSLISHTLGDSFAGKTPTQYTAMSTTAGVIITVSSVNTTTMTVNIRLHDGTTPASTTCIWTAAVT